MGQGGSKVSTETSGGIWSVKIVLEVQEDGKVKVEIDEKISPIMACRLLSGTLKMILGNLEAQEEKPKIIVPKLVTP